MTCLLAWVPLLQPLPLDDQWLLLLLPLIIAISFVYKALRMDNLKHLPQQATYMCVQIIIFLIASAAILWAVTRWV